MQPLILGLIILTIGALDFRRRVRLAKIANTIPENAKYLPWIILTCFLNWNYIMTGRVSTLFPIDNTNKELCRIVNRGWYTRIVFLFGVLFVIAGIFEILKH